MQTTISERGQTSIPAEIRKELNLKAKTKLAWMVDGDLIIVMPIPDDPIKAFRGKSKGLTEALLKSRREERELERREP
ncbi:MAG: AbrB/MazE/SpoVT family DNA-binding domain-containing protein [Deltaproteobacteria bacterium]|nr:MAG: AbrB/MazE/SpoVT family DNA-binding domain-containing protein [Deltaproteobacteria bacterium]